ncbi:unnamed protein product [Toxocara canis]|uniref:Transmembrane protein n=1 Tax=Toxocara canis TaxID=6265 RepID=A0A183UJD5_TOXCA|nr:unnamed protein product [Toxocara canis]
MLLAHEWRQSVAAQSASCYDSRILSACFHCFPSAAAAAAAVRRPFAIGRSLSFRSGPVFLMGKYNPLRAKAKTHICKSEIHTTCITFSYASVLIDRRTKKHDMNTIKASEMTISPKEHKSEHGNMRSAAVEREEEKFPLLFSSQYFFAPMNSPMIPLVSHYKKPILMLHERLLGRFRMQIPHQLLDRQHHIVVHRMSMKRVALEKALSERQQKKFDKEKSDSNESQVNPTTSEHLQKSAANTVSQPVHDVFVQCNQSFRRTDRKRYEQMLKARKNEEEHVHNFESTEAALAVQTFFHNLSLICQGMDTLSKGYDWIAMPVHATFYVCFVISTVSALDRFETADGLVQSLKKLANPQCACLGILFWAAGLLVTLASTPYDECLSVPSAEHCQVEFFVKPPVIWRWLSAIRAGAALFGWFLLALSPNVNYLRELIRQSEDQLEINVRKEDQLEDS